MEEEEKEGVEREEEKGTGRRGGGEGERWRHTMGLAFRRHRTICCVLIHDVLD